MAQDNKRVVRGAPGVLDFPCDVDRLPNGNTLITDAGDELSKGSEVIEIDPWGRVVWQFGTSLNFAHSARRLANGNTFICDTTNDRIVEVSPGGEIVFSSESWGGGTGRMSDGSHLAYPNDAHQLDDGTYIVTDRDNDRFVVVDRHGRVLWQFTDLKGPHNCDVIANGNVLCADSNNNRVIEVNRQGEIVWRYGDGSPEMIDWPRDADRLPNGDTLITDSRNSRVLIVNPTGKVVWEYRVDYNAMFYEADPLPDGHVLISDQFHQQIIEVDPSGTIVWMFRNRRIPHPIHPRLRNGTFRQRDDNGVPADWMVYTRLCSDPRGGTVIWTEDERERSCPGLSYDRNGALCLFQVVEVRPGTTYRLAGSIKTEDIAPDGLAYFQLAFLDSYGGLVENVETAPKGRIFTGTNDWTQDSFEALAPPEARSVEVRLFISGRGKAWMRDVMFFS
jgi:hypothetical protein